MHITFLSSLVHFPYYFEFLSSRELMRALAQLSRFPTLPLEEQRPLLITLFSRQKDIDIKYQIDYLKYNYNNLNLFKMVLELDTKFADILTQTMLSPASTLEHKLIIAHARHTSQNKLPLSIFRERTTPDKNSLPNRKFKYEQLVQSKLSAYDSLNQSAKYEQFCSDFIDFNYTSEPGSGQYVELDRFGQLIYPYDPKILSAVKKAFKTILTQLANNDVQKIVVKLVEKLSTNSYASKNDLLQISTVILEQKNIDTSALVKPILGELIKKSNNNAIPSTKLLISQLSTKQISKLIIKPLIQRLESTHSYSVVPIIKELFEFNNTVAKALVKPLIKKLTTDPNLIKSAQDLIPLIAPNMKHADLRSIVQQLLSLLEKNLNPTTQHWDNPKLILLQTIENLLPHLINYRWFLKYKIETLINYIAKVLTFSSHDTLGAFIFNSLLKITSFILKHQTTYTTILTQPIVQALILNFNQNAILQTKLLIPQLTEEQIQSLIFLPLLKRLTGPYCFQPDAICTFMTELLPYCSDATAEAFMTKLVTRFTTTTNTTNDHINTLNIISLLTPNLTPSLRNKLIFKMKDQDFHQLFLQLLDALEEEFERGANTYPVYTSLNRIHPYLNKADIQTYIHFLLDELNNPQRNQMNFTLFKVIKNLLAQLTNPEDIRLFIKPILNFFINLDGNAYLLMPLTIILLPLLNDDEIQTVKEVILRDNTLSYLVHHHFDELNLFLATLKDEDVKDFFEHLVNLSVKNYSNGNEIKIIDAHIRPKLNKEQQEQFMLHMLQPDVQLNRRRVYHYPAELSPMFVNEPEPTHITPPATEVIEVKKYYPNFISQLSVANRTSKAFQQILKEQVSEHQEIKDLQELQEVWLTIPDTEKNNTADNSSSTYFKNN